MNNSHKETISIRIISCAFMVLAIAIFKPFGLEVWQWQTCVHLRQTEDNPPVGGCDLDSQITLEGTTNEHVTLEISDLLYIEAVGNYVKVCQLQGNEVHTNMLRATMKQMEDSLQAYPMIVRCHRAFMVNLGQVEQISSNSRAMQLVMRHSHDAIPVSRSNVNKLKELLG